MVVQTSPDERLSPTPSPAKAAGSQFETWLLFALSCLLYAVTTGYDFVVDDKFLVKSPYVKSFHYLRQIFSGTFWSLGGQRADDSFYRPMVMMTVLTEHSIFGLRPQWYHLVNILFNAGVVVVVYAIAKVWWPKSRAGLWAALLFAALPVHAENVSPISGLSDVGCAFFMLLSVWIYLRDANRRENRRRDSWLAAGSLLIALLYKEVALTVPMLLIVYEHFLNPSGPREFRRGLTRYFPLVMVSLFYVAIRLEALHGFTGATRRAELGLWTTTLSAFSLLGMYIYKLVWPQQLSYFIKFHPPQSWRDLYVLLGLLSTLLGGIVVFRKWKPAPLVSFGLLWFFLTLAPALNIHWLGFSPYGERYLYIPSMGLCWMAGLGLARLTSPSAMPSRSRRRLAYALGSVVLALEAGRTVLRLPDWKDNLIVARATLRVAPDLGFCYVYEGNAYIDSGDRTRAREAYVKAIAMDPGCVEAYIDLAGVFMYDRKEGTARALLKRAAQIGPDNAAVFYNWGVVELGQGANARARQLFEQTLALNPYYYDALNNLGAMALDERNLGKAQEYLRRAAWVDPRAVGVRLNLGAVYAGQNKFREAEREFRLALDLTPQSDAPYLALAKLYEQQGRKSEALAVYQEAVRVDPRSGNAQFRLGVLARKVGELGQATRALELAAEIQPTSPLAHTELGLTYLAAGKASKARQELETALRLDPRNEPAREALQELH